MLQRIYTVKKVIRRFSTTRPRKCIGSCISMGWEEGCRKPTKSQKMAVVMMHEETVKELRKEKERLTKEIGNFKDKFPNIQKLISDKLQPSY